MIYKFKYNNSDNWTLIIDIVGTNRNYPITILLNDCLINHYKLKDQTIQWTDQFFIKGTLGEISATTNIPIEVKQYFDRILKLQVFS